MSFRPTIAVVIDKEVAHIGYYRNWQTEDLFIEALALAVLYRDCRSMKEFRERFFGTQTVYYRLDPEAFENTRENLLWLEECSEMPINVDLTRKVIYEGFSGAGDDFVFGKPGIRDITVPTSPTESFYWDLLTKHRISFDEVDIETVEELFMKDDKMADHLSVNTAAMIKKRKGETYDEAGKDQ